MKPILLSACLFNVLAVVLSAQSITITAKVLDRGPYGAAALGQYVYPEVVIESGEVASLHIGEDFRYAIWNADFEDSESELEIYKDIPVGFILSLKAAVRDDGIAYGGEAVSRVVEGVSEGGSSLSSKQAAFFGKVADGGIVEVQMTGGDGVRETIALHFATGATGE